eukprot:6871892-Lingulodinium_polyedra.AAC.1
MTALGAAIARDAPASDELSPSFTNAWSAQAHGEPQARGLHPAWAPARPRPKPRPLPAPFFFFLARIIGESPTWPKGVCDGGPPEAACAAASAGVNFMLT